MNQDIAVLEKPMKQALVRLMDELPTAINDLCDAMAAAGLPVTIAVNSITSNGDVYTIDVTAVTWTNRTATYRFKVEWAGKKAPALFDLYYWGREAWPPHSSTWLYGGLVASSEIAREISILSHGRQYLGTVMARGA